MDLCLESLPRCPEQQLSRFSQLPAKPFENASKGWRGCLRAFAAAIRRVEQLLDDVQVQVPPPLRLTLGLRGQKNIGCTPPKYLGGVYSCLVC